MGWSTPVSMHADASHPDQVRALLAEAAAVVTSPRERQRVEALHASAMGLVEGEHEASQHAWDQWLDDQAVMADLGLRRVPRDGDEGRI